MKKRKLIGLATMGVIASLTLAACGGGGGKKEKGGSGNGETETADISKFPIKTTNEDEAIEGGTLEAAMAMDTTFQGLFDPAFNEDAYDSRFMEVSHETLFGFDEHFMIDDSGVATFKLDREAKKGTIQLVKDAKWSDGQPVVAEDIIQPYLIIGHKDYAGVRYGAQFENIVGMTEYHEGKTEDVAGIKKIDDKTVEIEFKEVNPGLEMADGDGGIWQFAMPAHIFKDLPVKDMESSDPVRKNIVTFGPYKMSKIVRGEAVEYTPNEYYYQGKPKLDKIIIRQTPTDSIVEAMKSKKYDMIISMPTDNYSAYKDIEGYELLGRGELAYTYIGFKLGKWDTKAKRVAYDPESKMANKSLRQAMAYAIDNKAIGDKFYNGLRTAANTLVPPVLGDFHAEEVKGYVDQDVDKANKLLDEAGYKDTDGDGLREDPNGEKLEIKFASMSGGEVAQPMAEYYMDQWKEIGLDVKLTTGRLIDFQSFYDKLKNDDPEIDIYQAAWSISVNPSQVALFGPIASFNYTRFEDDKNTELLEAMDSEEAFDTERRIEIFHEWQEYAAEEAFAIPTLYRNELLPVSARVKNFDWNHAPSGRFWYPVELTAEER